ncbi:MAG TPA: hypothetical protein VGY58_20460, partial [Gemmataceae bacterium]|nr:hypothetical protein [Gemmataceae bacterium]
MVQYIESACPSCHRPVRIRTEYLGKRIACKYCNHTFVPEAGTLPPPPVAMQAPPGPDPATRQRIATLEEELKQARDELAIQANEHRTVTLKLQEAQGELAHLREAAQNLQRELDQAGSGQKQVSGLEEQLARLQGDHARVLEELSKQADAEKQALTLEWEQKHQARTQEADKLLTEEQAKATDHRQKWQELEQDRQTLARDLERQGQEVVKLRKAQETAAEQNKTLSQDLQQARQSVERQAQELGTLRKAQESSAQQISALTQDVQ